MNFLENIFRRLEEQPDTVFLQEIHEGKSVPETGATLLAQIKAARTFLRKSNLKRGDRCALIAHNTIRWVAMDLAILAEGIIVVPLYAHQVAAELVGMMKDCSPSLICCGDESLRDAIAPNWPEVPPIVTFDQMFSPPSRPADSTSADVAPTALADSDPVAIIYTSGTSGEPKGVVLGVSNLNHMLSCTSGRLDMLMSPNQGQERVFHYLPFSFAGSWIMLLTCLLRGSRLTMATDLSTLAADMRATSVHYFLNVPVLLERMRSGVEQQISKTGGLVGMIYDRAKAAWYRRDRGERAALDSLWLAIARAVIFPTIRKKMIGVNLRSLICGSAPLARDTQLFFHMLGVPVLQVYGLTETSAICTMDNPHQVEAGRVGPAIPGIEMKLAENDEIVVRGPNVFQQYWNRPQATAAVLHDGWFHTGDQGDVNQQGNWRISGRIKNLIILASGHNVAPEPIEDEMLRLLPDAQQIVLIGHGRRFLAAVVTGSPLPEQVQFAINEINPRLPHYKRVRAFHIQSQPFSVENGMLTANGKLKRDAIALGLQAEIDAMYAARQEVSA
jgi:long-chain acyl-CoA synthetase